MKKDMNLVICTTPFQLLLVEKIIETYPDEIYSLLYISGSRSDKNLYYYNRLKLKVINSEFIHIDWVSKIGFLIFLLKLKKRFYSYPLWDGVNKILLGSLDSIYIHIIIHGIIRNEKVIVQTFDDGTANIDRNSFLYKETRFSKKMKLFNILLCRGTDLFLLKSKSKKHYSVYKNQSNIIENVEYLQLYNKYAQLAKNNISGINLKVCRIFLGQPIYELNLIKNSYNMKIHYALINDIFNSFKIDYYFPHPREKELNLKLAESIQIIETPKIFEDYFLANYSPDIKYSVYTFFSGSVLPMIDLPNVEIVFVKIKALSVDLIDIYDFFENNLKEKFNLITY